MGFCAAFNPVKPKAAGKRLNGMQPTDTKLEGEPGTERALVRDVKQGNMAALELLIRRHTGKLFRIAFRVTKCREECGRGGSGCVHQGV
jgi:hypothetical protein